MLLMEKFRHGLLTAALLAFAAAAAAGLQRPSPASQPQRSEGEARSGRGGWTSGR